MRESLAAKPEKWGVRQATLLTPAQRINALHERGLAHGDLKPENILDAHPTDAEPTLIDLLDFSSEADGEIRTRRTTRRPSWRCFARPVRGHNVEETSLSLPGEASPSLALAIETCRTGPPENATLLPIIAGELVIRRLS